MTATDYIFGKKEELALPTGLVAHYPLTETEGNFAIDIIGGNDGEHGAQTEAPIMLGSQGYNFPTSGEIVRIPDSDVLSFTDGTTDLPFSCRALVTFSSLTASAYQLIMIKGDATTGFVAREWELSYQSGAFAIRIYTEGRNNRYRQFSRTFTPVLGQEYDVVGVYEGGTTFKFYINAVQGGSYSSVGAWVRMYNSNTGLYLARWNPNGGSSFYGSMRGVRIYNKALTLEEVQGLYNNGTPIN